MNTSHTRSHGARTLGGSGTHTAAYRLLGIAATLSLVLQMLSPLLGSAAPLTALADEVSPISIETPSDSEQTLPTSETQVPGEDPAPVVDEQPTPDTTAPVVTVPGTILATADATGLADVQFGDQIAAVDDVDGPIAVTADPDSGAFPVGDTTVTVTATDSAGNVGTATFVVSVSAAPVPTEIPEPTAVPTEEPIVEPTAVPTEEPTMEPTDVPDPTAVPTVEPIEVATAEPTTEPTEVSTVAPVDTPVTVPKKKDQAKSEAKAPSADLIVAAATGPVSVNFQMAPSSIGTLSGVQYYVYNNFTCSGDPDLAGTFTTPVNYYGYYQVVVQPGQSVSVTAPTFPGYPFTSWTSIQGGGTTTTNPTLCQSTESATTIYLWQANYLISSTTLTTTSVTGVFNSTVALSATLRTPSGSAVVGKTITFTLNGVNRTASTNASGVATLSGAQLMPLSGLPAGSVNTFTATFAGDGNYTGSSATGTVRIGLLATMTWGVDRYTYDGTPKAREVITSPAGLTGVTVTYTGTSVTYGPTTTPPTRAGNYSVVASLNNPDYAAANISGSFFILKSTAPVTITVTNLTQTYDGTPKPVTVTTDPVLPASDVFVRYGYSATICGTSATPFTIAGTYYVCVSLANYSATSNFQRLTIVRAPVTVTADPQTKLQGEPDPALTYTITSGSLFGTDTFTGQLARAAGETPGPYAITQNTLALSANYTLTYVGAMLTITSTITPTTLTLGGLTATYDGNPHPVSVTTDPAGQEGNVTFLYTGIAPTVYPESSVAPTDAGSYTVVATLATATHQGTATDTLVISPLTVTITPDSGQSKVYGTAGPVLTFTNDAGLTLDMFTGALSRVPGEDVGFYAITIGDLGAGTNYSLVLTATPVMFEITKATATLELVIADLTQTVGSTHPVDFTVVPDTLRPDVVVTYTGIDPTVYGPSTVAPADAGSYSVVASLANVNYTAPDATGTLVISRIITTLTLGGLTATYDGNPHPVSVTTDPAGQEGNVTFLYTGIAPTVYPESSVAPTDAGSYTVVATLATATHQGTATDTLVISPLTVTITPDSGQSKVYGTAGPVLTFTNDAGLTLDMFTGALSRVPGEDVGFYAITMGDLGAGTNYTLVLTATPVMFEITVALIEVTADNLTKVYGTGDPTLTYAITNGALVGTDTFTGALTRVPGENVGPHEIQQGTLALSNNYALSFITGNLEITPLAITVTADTITKEFGTPDPTLTYTVTSGALVGTDAFTGELTRDPGTAIGTYTIRQGTLALDSNYILTFIPGSLQITHVMNVATIALSVTQGAPLTKVTVTGEGFLPREYVELRWDMLDGSVLRTVRASSQGTFSTSVIIPASAAAGPNDVIGIGVDSKRIASASFEVIIPAVSLTLSPIDGPTRTSVSISGDGFMPRELIEIRWDGVDGPILRTVQASSAGTFVVSIRIDRSVTPGIYDIFAVGLTSNRTATAPFTVTDPAMVVPIP